MAGSENHHILQEPDTYRLFTSNQPSMHNTTRIRGPLETYQSSVSSVRPRIQYKKDLHHSQQTQLL